MARQAPRPKGQTLWRSSNAMPPRLVDAGVMPWAAQHMQQHPYCWACQAPGTQHLTVLSRHLNPVGGNVTFYTLCETCATDPEVRQRIEADVEQDEIIAKRHYN